MAQPQALALQAELKRQGAAISLEWCCSFLTSNPDKSLQCAISHLLVTDLHAHHDHGSSGCLSVVTSSDQELHACHFFLQCDELIDVAAPARERFRDGGGGGQRMLKLRLTDGKNTMSAFEYHLIPNLSPSLPAGVKLLIKGDMSVRSGILVLQSNNVEVLGGQVARLEEARRRALEVWDRPVGGKEGQRRDPFTEARAAAASSSSTPPLVHPIIPVPIEIDESGDEEEIHVQQPRATINQVQQPLVQPRATTNQVQPPAQRPQAAAAVTNQVQVIEIDDDDDEDLAAPINQRPEINCIIHELIRRIEQGEAFGHRFRINSVTFSNATHGSDGRDLFVNLDDGTGEIRCMATEEMQRQIFRGTTINEDNDAEQQARIRTALEDFYGSVIVEWSRVHRLLVVIEAEDID